jgi:hypothetical protein
LEGRNETHKLKNGKLYSILDGNGAMKKSEYDYGECCACLYVGMVWESFTEKMTFKQRFEV